MRKLIRIHPTHSFIYPALCDHHIHNHTHTFGCKCYCQCLCVCTVQCTHMLVEHLFTQFTDPNARFKKELKRKQTPTLVYDHSHTHTHILGHIVRVSVQFIHLLTDSFTHDQTRPYWLHALVAFHWIEILIYFIWHCCSYAERTVLTLPCTVRDSHRKIYIVTGARVQPHHTQLSAVLNQELSYFTTKCSSSAPSLFSSHFSLFFTFHLLWILRSLSVSHCLISLALLSPKHVACVCVCMGATMPNTI